MLEVVLSGGAMLRAPYASIVQISLLVERQRCRNQFLFGRSDGLSTVHPFASSLNLRVLSTIRRKNPGHLSGNLPAPGTQNPPPFLAHELRRLVHGQKSQRYETRAGKLGARRSHEPPPSAESPALYLMQAWMPRCRIAPPKKRLPVFMDAETLADVPCPVKIRHVD